MLDSEAAASAGSSSSPSQPAAANASGAEPKAEQGAVAPVATTPSRGIDLITGPEGDIRGFAVSPVAQLYATVDRLVATPKIVALPTEGRFALAGKVAAIPAEHARLVERLASSMATSISEAGALNALYILETCKELVPGFKDVIPADRLAKAAELSPHARLQSAILLGEKPPEWEKVAQMNPQSSLVLLQEEEESDLLKETGRVVGDATKFVGGAALGGVGLITDTLGVTKGAEDTLVDAAEDAVDIVGDGINAAVDAVDGGISGTAVDFQQKGIAGTVGDGMADAMDMVTDFVGDAVHGIAGGVKGALDYLAGEENHNRGVMATHKVAIVVAELFGDERSLGLRLENRVVTRFTKPEAEKLGWRLGDCILAVGQGPVATQDEMLAAISQAKEALKNAGTPIRFIVERLGEKPAGPKRGDLVFVSGRAARIQSLEPATGTMIVKFQDDGSVARAPARQQ